MLLTRPQNSIAEFDLGNLPQNEKGEVPHFGSASRSSPLQS